MTFKKLISIIILGLSIHSHTTLAKESIVLSSYNKSMIDMMVAEVLDTTIDSVKIEALRGGFSGDKLFLISHGDIKIVARIHPKNKDIKHKRLEYEASKNASDLGIGPKVLYVSKNYDLIVTEYIKAKHPDLKLLLEEKQIDHMVESLLKLHNGPKLPNNWSIFEYIKKITPQNPNEKEKLSITELEKIKNAFLRIRFQRKPCHNDIQANNLFIIDNKVLFIDWGDAGMSDPFWDLARISMECAFRPTQDQYLLTKYLGNVTKLDKSRFFIMKQVFILRFAFCLKNIPGYPDKKSLKDIIKTFEANNYYLNIKDNEKVTWSCIYVHAINLFLKNSKKDLYKESLNILNQEAKTHD